MTKNSNHIWKLGMFVIIGIVFFAITIYFIGKTQNLFGATFQLNANFKNVSGLKVGNNVRLSGINIGTVKSIEFVSDSLVKVNFVIQDDVQKYIKTDAMVSIGSDGLMGDKVLTISPGSKSTKVVEDNTYILSSKAVEMEDMMKSVKVSIDNAKIISQQLAEFSYKMNNNDGLLSKLLTDKSFANKLDNTMVNLETSSNEFSNFSKKMNNKNNVISKLVDNEKLGKSVDSSIINIQNASKGLNEIEEAAKKNFLLKGYFNKKEKAALKKQKELEKTANKKNDSIVK
ncbi:MlaD family protein [Flavobacterium sp. RSB2_4_14]|uniref:MlaD family protein n=1 Tax=Flavobacterium sp. RSB2_4_14 TaxID=3447665 RepID=UPI003F34411A